VALVVQAVEGQHPSGRRAEAVLHAVLLAHLDGMGLRSPVEVFFFRREFPVDVRHNAKIHRLTLNQQIAGKQPIKLEELSL
jgi:olefin beta-lactone synthetase